MFAPHPHPHPRLLLRGLRRAGDAVGGLSGELAGELGLVTTTVLAVGPCAALLGRYRGLHPGVRVTGRDEELPGMLADGCAEVAVTCLPVPERDVAVLKLGEHEIMAVFPGGRARPSRSAGLSNAGTGRCQGAASGAKRSATARRPASNAACNTAPSVARRLTAGAAEPGRTDRTAGPVPASATAAS